MATPSQLVYICLSEMQADCSVVGRTCEVHTTDCCCPDIAKYMHVHDIASFQGTCCPSPLQAYMACPEGKTAGCQPRVDTDLLGGQRWWVGGRGLRRWRWR